MQNCPLIDTVSADARHVTSEPVASLLQLVSAEGTAFGDLFFDLPPGRRAFEQLDFCGFAPNYAVVAPVGQREEGVG